MWCDVMWCDVMWCDVMWCYSDEWEDCLLWWETHYIKEHEGRMVVKGEKIEEEEEEVEVGHWVRRTYFVDSHLNICEDIFLCCCCCVRREEPQLLPPLALLLLMMYVFPPLFSSPSHLLPLSLACSSAIHIITFWLHYLLSSIPFFFVHHPSSLIPHPSSLTILALSLFFFQSYNNSFACTDYIIKINETTEGRQSIRGGGEEREEDIRRKGRRQPEQGRGGDKRKEE